MVVKMDNNKEPLYLQAKDYVLEKIRNESWKPGERIPTEGELEKILKVSRTTIRNAISELQYEGYVTKQQGCGTFVTEEFYAEQLPMLKSFTEDAARLGGVASSILLGLDEIIPTNDILKHLKCKSTEKVLKLSRIRCMNEKPIQYTNSYIPERTYCKMKYNEIDWNKASFYTEIEKTGTIIAGGDETLEVCAADQLDSIFLGISEGAPMLLAKRVAYDQGGMPVAYDITKTRGDRYKTKIKLWRSPKTKLQVLKK
jgi:GntR family transcriptional regulator